MNRFLAALLGLAGMVVLASSASASQLWQKSCQSGANNATNNVNRGGFVCNDSVANTNSEMLFTGDCENIDILFAQDLSQAGASTSTANIYSCMSPTDASGDGPTDAGWSAADTCWIMENITLDGISSTNTEAIYGSAAVWIYSDTVIYGAADTPRVIVRCNP
jgi:hypothetical protein